MSRLLQTSDDKSFAMVRLLLGFVVFVRGAQGLLGWFGGSGIHDLSSFLRFVSLPEPLVLVVALVGFFGGIGLIAGLFTRVVAVSVAAETAFMLVLWPINPHLFMDWAITEGGASVEFYLLVLALAIVLVVKGAGALSLDRLLFSRTVGANAPWIAASSSCANGSLSKARAARARMDGPLERRHLTNA
ncbi:MAG TPA: DoxX family protein [Terriglobia bacterium]|nr:DoxX family protein [Terriglobia bacterium]